MDIKFKTLDKQRFTMNVDPHDQVEDLIFRLENRLGRENLYRLIYAGKLLKEGTPVSNYNISPKLPVIIMITQPLQQKVDKELIEEMERIRRNNITENKDDKVRDSQLRTENEDSGYDSDEDMHTNFVTENEFSVALDVVMTCGNLVGRNKTPLTKDEMVSYINTELNEEDDVESNLMDQILENIDFIFKRIPNTKQISAFLVDIQIMFNETRDIYNSMGGKKSSNEMKWVNQNSTKADPSNCFQSNNSFSFPHGNEEFQLLNLMLQDPSQLQPFLLNLLSWKQEAF
eukprot:GFUD01131661.1.p1 GENE.GFUD01131661.1~~GFUD01131661.1.p1  ORF type:complete len:300 (+),score=64.89 GFUD01131661.1:40-900(+)